MLLIAAGIALVILSITLLVKAVGDAQLGFGQLAGIALILLPVMAGFVGLLWALSLVLPALGGAAGVAALPLLALGGAIFLMATGIALIIFSITKLVDSFASLGENTGIVASGITSIMSSITLLVVAAAVLGGAVAIMTSAMVGASIGVTLFMGSMIGLLAAIPMLFFIRQCS